MEHWAQNYDRSVADKKILHLEKIISFSVQSGHDVVNSRELRHDFGTDVRLFWYVGLQVTHHTWRLEGPKAPIIYRFPTRIENVSERRASGS